MVAPTAIPKRIARSTAPLFNTGKTPGNAISTAHAWALGVDPKAVEAPEKIFDCVESCACVSSPMTTSHFICIHYLKLVICEDTTAHAKLVLTQSNVDLPRLL